jgi:hypothetical protein
VSANACRGHLGDLASVCGRAIRERAGLQPGSGFDVLIDDLSIR